MAARTSQTYKTFAALMRQGRPSEALSFAEHEALNGRERPSFWHTQRAVALNRMKHFAEARDAAQEALQSEPAGPYALLAMAEALLGEGRVDEAASIHEQVARSPDERAAGRARTGLLDCAMRRHDWHRVLSLLSSGGIRSREAHSYRARALKALGRHDEALEACRALLAEQPDNPGALWLQTDIEIERDGLESVRSRLGRLARIPSRPPVYGEIYASLCRRAGVHEAALGQYDKLHARTGDARLMRKKAFALTKTDHAYDALPLIEELLRMTPHDQYLHSSYASVCRRNGLHARALSFYRKLLEKNPEHKHLYGRLRRMEKALSEDETPE